MSRLLAGSTTTFYIVQHIDSKMMIYHLENENINISVNFKGAELKSIFNKVSQQELLWQADPEFWGKSSPVLFPIVGMEFLYCIHLLIQVLGFHHYAFETLVIFLY